MQSSKFYFIVEGFTFIGSIIFVIALSFYNKTLLTIKSNHENNVSQAFAIVREPQYPKYLLAGILIIAFLCVFTWCSAKKAKYEDSLVWINIPINIIFLLVIVSSLSIPIIWALIIVGCVYLSFAATT